MNMNANEKIMKLHNMKKTMNMNEKKKVRLNVQTQMKMHETGLNMKVSRNVKMKLNTMLQMGTRYRRLAGYSGSQNKPAGPEGPPLDEPSEDSHL
jgi:hypothetical protein